MLFLPLWAHALPAVQLSFGLSRPVMFHWAKNVENSVASIKRIAHDGHVIFERVGCPIGLGELPNDVTVLEGSTQNDVRLT